ncbi:hypothetical protein [Cohnella lupini]|uniref:Uncharacterized protein n=1 Tax=Cohnella lupini TaxID=1294267 RepID=A0A3D9IFC8_9BACL|nr:hypothetical protein [Cohnella lupini]RED60249.1 hypothetical protein DFP95_10638 [Cohnella lupini]
MSELTFLHYMRIDNRESEQTFRAEMEIAGYFSFYAFVEDFRGGLKTYSDEDRLLYGRKLTEARDLFPTPERFSPSWREIWNEFDLIFECKNEALDKIARSERNGEWQIVLDNPFSHQPVICYPSLAFLEAAYMYGYFQRELKPHECLRLQKVTQLLMKHGRKEASIFPDA